MKNLFIVSLLSFLSLFGSGCIYRHHQKADIVVTHIDADGRTTTDTTKYDKIQSGFGPLGGAHVVYDNRPSPWQRPSGTVLVSGQGEVPVGTVTFTQGGFQDLSSNYKHTGNDGPGQYPSYQRSFNSGLSTNYKYTGGSN